MIDPMKQIVITLALALFSSLGMGTTKKLVCKHYVVNQIEFCTVTLTVLEDGSIESPVNVNHQGSNQKSVINEIELQEGDLYRLLLDADKPGHEIEMVVSSLKNETGEYPAVLINHEAPFAKEMHGTCTEN